MSNGSWSQEAYNIIDDVDLVYEPIKEQIHTKMWSNGYS